MADLIETLTSLQEAIFLGAVAGLNRTEHQHTEERNSLVGRKTSRDTIFPEFADDLGIRQTRDTMPHLPQRRIDFSRNMTEGRHAMSDHLDVIVLDDDPQMSSLIAETLEGFYSWGDVHSFTHFNEALAFCKKKKKGAAIFILDVYLDKRTAFDFLDQIPDQCARAAEGTVIITGNASDDIVNTCIASNITYLLEKPIRVHALKLAVRAIVGKYHRFAERVLENSEYAGSTAKI